MTAATTPLKKQKTNLLPTTKKPTGITKDPDKLEKDRPVTAEDKKLQREILNAIYLGKFYPKIFVPAWKMVVLYSTISPPTQTVSASRKKNHIYRALE